MLMDTIFKNIKTLVNSSVIKIDSLAKKYETLESIESSDSYISAVQKTDRFDLYTVFDLDVIIESEITSDSDLQVYYANNPSEIPLEFRDIVLETQRQYIIDNYVEINNYYRMLSGLPDIDAGEDTFIKLTPAQQLKSDVYTDEYVQFLSDDDIYKIESSGVLEELIAQYPTYQYLNHLGSKKIDIVLARITNNFGILKVDNGNVPDEFYNTFLQIYDQNREYFMTVIYMPAYSSSYRLYDNFIGLCIMLMTIQRIISNTFKFGIQRDFYDWTFIQNIYKMYNVPFIKNLPLEYHVIILRNLNNLLRYKSTDKVLFDIASLLGYERLNIFKYYLIRRHKLDENEQPLFFYKHKLDEFGNPMFDDNGNPIYIEDNEKMYDIYFQKVSLKEQNISLALQDETNKVEFNEVILDDPYWWVDDDTENMRYNETYDYIETKYLGLNLMYRMTEMLFELTYAFRMIIDKKDEITSIRLSIPKIYPDSDFKLFDIIIFIIALMCKKHGFADGLITTPSKISHIYGFNFDTELIDKIRSIITDNSKIVDHKLLEYFNDLTINNPEEVNELFYNIREYNNFILDKMRMSTDIREYNLYKDIFKISMISETQTDMFMIDITDEDGNIIETRPAHTYLEYLDYSAPILAQIVKDTGIDSIPNMVDHLTSVVDDLIKELHYLFIINDNNNPVFTALISLMKFFKSYTVDLSSFSIIYLFDSKYYNMYKMIEDIHLIRSFIQIDGSLDQIYSDDPATINSNLKTNDDIIKITDLYNSLIHSLVMQSDNTELKDSIISFDNTLQYNGMMDYEYASDLIYNTSNEMIKDKSKMKDKLILFWDD